VGHVEVESLTFPTASDSNVTATSADGAAPSKNTRKVKATSKARHHFLLMAGLGIDAAVMSHVPKPLKYRIGPLAVGISAAEELPKQHPFPIEIRAAGEGRNGAVLWKGEAIQVVIGNTRKYANIVEMTPNAYIDDGVLDVCVITAGDPLSTLQQITSLLLRKKPDNLTAEYFHGSQLSISVPASVPMQLDGSTVKLKDYLNSSDYDTLHQARDVEDVRKALSEVAIAFFGDGRKVVVVGKAPDVEKKQTYVIAGNAAKRTTGEMRPVAVVVNSNTAVFNREGMQVSSEAMQELQ